MTRNFYLSRAFTLIELLIVIAVIAILGTVAYPVFIGTQERAKVTKDMNNLRQIGLATQTYMNDNDGTVFSPATSWMSQLYSKYQSAWNVFLCPFDNPVSPRTASDNNANSVVSYGINFNSVGIAADTISKPTVFILFAPAQDSTATVSFQGTADTTSQVNLASSPNVTVLGIGGGQATSTPGGTNAAPPPPHGTHSSRTRINALFADLHAESMNWTTFANDEAIAGDPDGQYRWNPVPTPTPPP